MYGLWCGRIPSWFEPARPGLSIHPSLSFSFFAALCATTSLKKFTRLFVGTASGKLLSLPRYLSTHHCSRISYSCIRRMLLQSPHCPICKVGFPPQNPIHPSFSRKTLHTLVTCFIFHLCLVNDLVTKYKLEKADSAKHRCCSTDSKKLLETVSAASDDG